MNHHNNITNLINSIPGNTYQQKLDNLSLCNCCIRHRNNRPSFYMPWIELPYNNNNNHSLNNFVCNCNCRHIARFICRQHPGYNPPLISQNSPKSITSSLLNFKPDEIK